MSQKQADPSTQPPAEPTVPSTPEENSMVDAFRNQPVDSQARPDTSALDDLKAHQDQVFGGDS